MKKASIKAIAAFLVSLMICSALAYVITKRKAHMERANKEYLILEKSIKVAERVSKLLYKTQALASLVIQSNGDVHDFDRVAAVIVDDPSIVNVLLAPEGIVSNVYPLAGNKELLGYNLFGGGQGNKEAIAARDQGQLIMGGPFELMQGGGQALVGRLPVWLEGPDKVKKFWGIVSVTLKYPQALSGVGLDLLQQQNISYELWRHNPDTDSKQIIASGGRYHANDADFVEKHIKILNANWYFRLLIDPAWEDNFELWTILLMGSCASLLVALIVQNNHSLGLVKRNLENIMHIDALTGLYNRTGLFCQLRNAMRNGTPFHLYYIDLNHFKNINDTYGHNVGDEVLVNFSKRISNFTTENHLFARMGGDEFIIAILNDATANSSIFWEKVDNAFSWPICSLGNGEEIVLGFSRGFAEFPKDSDCLDELLHIADTKMYQDKHAMYNKRKQRRFSDFKPDPAAE